MPIIHQNRKRRAWNLDDVSDKLKQAIIDEISDNVHDALVAYVDEFDDSGFALIEHRGGVKTAELRFFIDSPVIALERKVKLSELFAESALYIDDEHGLRMWRDELVKCIEEVDKALAEKARENA